MFILDTNVVSELFRPAPADEVVAWIADADPARLFVTTISKAEILLGVALMQPGRRKDALESVLDAFFREKMRTDILPFGEMEAVHFARIVSHRRSIGRPIGEFAAQIGAIARAHDYAIVTRNARDFADCGIGVINPFAEATQ